MPSLIQLNKVVRVAVVFALGVSLSGCGTRTKTVSAATIGQLPPGKTFEIDLTRGGTIYEFNDASTDFRRVTIRTSAGVKTFADLLKASNTSVRTGLVLAARGENRVMHQCECSSLERHHRDKAADDDASWNPISRVQSEQ
jgi:hypothetical protein